MNAGSIRQVFLLILGLTYIGFGVYIFIKKIIGSPWSEVLGVVFVIYGAWRTFRAVKNNTRIPEDE